MSGSRSKRRWIGAVVLALAVAGIGLASRRAYDTALMLADLAHVDLPLPDYRHAFVREDAEFTVGGESRSADLYLPQAAVRAALVLVPGAAEGGRADPRLVELAETLARTGFAVLVPEEIVDSLLLH